MSAEDTLSATSIDVASGEDQDIADQSGCDVDAYHYWCEILQGRAMPSVRDLNPSKLELFKTNSYLLSFHADEDDYKVRFAGALLSDQNSTSAALTGHALRQLDEMNIIVKLRDLYDAVRANASPLVFDLPLFRDGENLIVHGILLPLGEDGQKASFILGVLRGIEPVADANSDHEDDSIDALLGMDAVEEGSAATFDQDENLEQLDEDRTDKEEGRESVVDDDGDDDHIDAWHDERDALDADDDHAQNIGAASVEDRPSAPSFEKTIESSDQKSDQRFGGYNADEPLINLLSKSRTSAGNINHLDSRSRESLYDVLAQAYAVYEEALLNPSGYEALLRGKGIKVQARAPFTPVIKLIFGVDYDKTRITEYAAALSYAQRNGQTPDTFKSFIMAQPGGIKGCVKAERIAKRKDKGVSADVILDEAREKLRRFSPLGSAELSTLGDDKEFVLLLGRKGESGKLVDVIGVIEEKEDFVNAVLKRAVKSLRQ